MIPPVGNAVSTPQDFLARRDTPNRDPLRSHADQIGQTSLDGRSPSVPESESSRRHEESPRDPSRDTSLRDPELRARDEAKAHLRNSDSAERGDLDRSVDVASADTSFEQAPADIELELNSRERPTVSIQDRAPDERDFLGLGRDSAVDGSTPPETTDGRDQEAAVALRNIQEARDTADAKFETARIGDAEKAARVLRELQAREESRREAAEAEHREQRADKEADSKQIRKHQFEIARRSTRANVAEFLEITRRSVFDQVI